MKPITLPVAELKPVLTGLSKVITKRPTLPILGCVRIERTAEGSIQLSATDLEVWLIATLPTPDESEPADLLVPFEDLHNLTKTCGRGDSLLIESAADQRAVIRYPVANQTLEHRCESLPVAEFPERTRVSGESIPIAAALRGAIHEALACASTDATRLILNGAYLDTSKPKAHYVVGTDGRHLFSSNSFVLPLATPLLIPQHRFLGWKDFNTDGDWSLRVGPPAENIGTHFEIASAHWRFSGCSLEGNYPNWRMVQPAAGSVQTTIQIEPDSLDRFVQSILRLPNHDPVNFTIGVEIKNRCLSLLSKSTKEDPWTSFPLEGVTAFGADVTVMLNRNLLSKAWRFGLTKLEVIDARTPVRFSAGGRQMIVMPIHAEPAPAPVPPTPPAAPVPDAAIAITPPPLAETTHEKPMPSSNPNPNPNPNGGDSRPPIAFAPAAEKPPLEVALAQLDIVRGDFRSLIVGLQKLGEALKQVQREQKASDKDLSSVRATLRSLQTVRL